MGDVIGSTTFVIVVIAAIWVAWKGPQWARLYVITALLGLTVVAAGVALLMLVG